MYLLFADRQVPKKLLQLPHKAVHHAGRRRETRCDKEAPGQLTSVRVVDWNKRPAVGGRQQTHRDEPTSGKAVRGGKGQRDIGSTTEASRQENEGVTAGPSFLTLANFNLLRGGDGVSHSPPPCQLRPVDSTPTTNPSSRALKNTSGMTRRSRRREKTHRPKIMRPTQKRTKPTLLPLVANRTNRGYMHTRLDPHRFNQTTSTANNHKVILILRSFQSFTCQARCHPRRG